MRVCVYINISTYALKHIVRSNMLAMRVQGVVLVELWDWCEECGARGVFECQQKLFV